MRRLDISVLKEYAKKHNGTLLSEQYINRRTKYLWKCNLGHIWSATASDVRNGYWCSRCPIIRSKQEIELFKVIKEFFPDAQNNIIGLLPSPRLELDIYVPSLRKAIEFDGEYWHNKQPERDERKNKECNTMNINLIRVRYKDYRKNKQLVTQSILDWLRS